MNTDETKTKEQLISELKEIRERLIQLEKSKTERKQMKGKLRESEVRYRSLFERMLNGLAYCQIIVDENNQPDDFIYLAVNDAFEKLTGLRREDVIGKKVTEAIPGTKESHPELFSIYGKVALTGEETQFDIFFKPLSIWLTISVYCPQKGYFVAVFENITERKQAEEVILQSEERFRTSVETLLDGFAVFSAIRDEAGHIVDFRYEYINEAGCQLNQWTREEQIGHTLLELLPGHKEIGLFDGYVEVVETGRPLSRESVLYEDVWGEGQRVTRAFDFQAVKLRDGFAVDWRDITEHKRAEEEVREFKLIADSAAYGVAIGSIDGILTYVNKSFAQMHGYTPDKLVGRHFSILYTEEQMPIVQKLRDQLMQTGSFAGEEMWHRRKDGTEERTAPSSLL